MLDADGEAIAKQSIALQVPVAFTGPGFSGTFTCYLSSYGVGGFRVDKDRPYNFDIPAVDSYKRTIWYYSDLTTFYLRIEPDD